VQAVYRCVGYRSTELADLPWDPKNHVVPHNAGRVLDINGRPIPGVYVNGWVKRGPVGLIGHTKGDAIETVGSLLEDVDSLPAPADPSPEGIVALLEERGLQYTTWEGWEKLDAHEISLGQPHDRARIKVVPREGMLDASRR
jgi:ferredoxin--NADP+ reductase